MNTITDISPYLTDTVGAAKILNCTGEAVRWHVKKGNLKSYQFVEGILTERLPGEQTRGRDLIFLRSEVEAMPRRNAGRPRREE